MAVKPFGKQFRADFPLEDEYIPICHGAHGSYPIAVQAYVDEYNRRAEKHPDRWHRFDFRPLLQENLERAAALVKCDPKDIVFVANSSAGVNNILRSFPFEEGDKILCVSCINLHDPIVLLISTDDNSIKPRILTVIRHWNF